MSMAETSALDDLARTDVTRLMPEWLICQRWFGAKDAKVEAVQVRPLGTMAGARCALTVLDVELSQGPQWYFLPLSRVEYGDPALNDPSANSAVLATRDGAALMDGASDSVLAEALLDGMRARSTLRHDQWQVIFEGTEALDRLATDKARLLSVEQSNATLAFDEIAVLKIYRRLRAGIQPDVEVARHLTLGGFDQTPPFLGAVTLHEANTDPTLLAAAFAFVPNQGDAWAYLGMRLRASMEHEGDRDDAGLGLCRLLGSRTAGLHRALARATDDPAFAPEPVTTDDLRAWSDEAREDLREAFFGLENALDRLDDGVASIARQVLDRREEAFDRIDRISALEPSGEKHRIHGDYHLGQVLVTEDDVAIIDFEGEPRRNLAARRAKTSGLRDVAGMLRSLDYAAGAVSGAAETNSKLMDAWRVRAMQAFLDAYRAEIAGSAAHPDEPVAEPLLELFRLQKVGYEIAYELSNRPAWVHLPLGGLLALLDEELPQ